MKARRSKYNTIISVTDKILDAINPIFLNKIFFQQSF